MNTFSSSAANHLSHDHPGNEVIWKLKYPEEGLALGSPLLTDPSSIEVSPLDLIQFGQISTYGLNKLLHDKGDRQLLLRPEACQTETICIYAWMDVV